MCTQQMSEILSKQKELEELNISENDLQKGIITLIESLTIARNLCELNICKNQIKASHIKKVLEIIKT